MDPNTLEALTVQLITNPIETESARKVREEHNRRVDEARKAKEAEEIPTVLQHKFDRVKRMEDTLGPELYGHWRKEIPAEAAIAKELKAKNAERLAKETAKPVADALKTIQESITSRQGSTGTYIVEMSNGMTMGAWKVTPKTPNKLQAVQSGPTELPHELARLLAEVERDLAKLGTTLTPKPTLWQRIKAFFSRKAK